MIAPILAIIAVIYTELAQDEFSQDWKDLLSWSGDGGLFSMSESESMSANAMIGIVFCLILLVVGIANQIAMFFFWRLSRHIFAILCLLGFVATLSLGLLVSPPIESFLMELSLFISGVTLALCYFSDPVVHRFLETIKTEQGTTTHSKSKSE